MPSFQPPVSSSHGKRKSGIDEASLPASKRPAIGTAPPTSTASRCWMVQWRNPQYKKHKTWDGDGVLVVRGTFFDLLDAEDGRRLSCGKPNGIEPDKIEDGTEFSLNGKDLQIDHSITWADYSSGACFANGVTVHAPAEPVPSVLRNSVTSVKQFTPLKPRNGLNFKTPTSVRAASGSAASGSATPNCADNEDAIVRKSTPDSFWMVNWRKPQHKKHKTWDGDAYLMHRGDMLTLVSEKGLVIGTKRWDGVKLAIGWTTHIGNKEIELDSQIASNDMPAVAGTSVEYENELEFGSPPQTQTPHSFTSPLALHARKASLEKSAGSSAPPEPSSSTAKRYVAPTAFYAKAQPKPTPKPKGPLYDPDAEGAIVMTAPTPEHIAKHNRKNAPLVPVVIDPILARRLRPHQIEGVKFMYECVMAMKGHDGKGCILADEMGLGKTLQTIALVWTLLKQNPFGGIGPVIGKVLIVCPVSLINNWKNEFHKWLGRDRVGVFVGDKDKGRIKQFINSRIHQVLIIGYERLRTLIGDLQYCIPPIGLIICDEGHRLKSANNKTSTMFEVLSTPRRIILSGTPIQNDLGEFHAMAEFCNPGLLGNDKSFKRLYEVPILNSRSPESTTKERELGEARMQQLMEVASTFVLRRSASILKGVLPPKYEYVVFVNPTQLQRDIFCKILSADRLDSLVRNSTAESLALIGLLTKISNSPILLRAAVDQARERERVGGGCAGVIGSSAVADAVQLLPTKAQVEDVSLSGKLAALANLLRTVYKSTEEKCIVVSHYTSTLNVIEAFLKKKNYSHCRLDGSTPASKRQDLVNEFNKTSQKQRFVFLLSSKAGGVGLNLVGASRLCLIDSDWNPSHDLQSMARIHRDGQKRPVYIYRFLTAGCIDEKIYQRQVTKLGLSDSLLGKNGNDSKSDSFTRKDLRDIFTIHPLTPCHTHDLLECPCDTGSSGTPASAPRSGSSEDVDTDVNEDEDQEMGFVSASNMDPGKYARMDAEYIAQKKAQLAALGSWKHVNCLRPNAREEMQDVVLRRLVYVPPDEQREQGGEGGLLDEIDLERVLRDTRSALRVDEVPGGAVSFVFERTSVEGEEDQEGQGEDDLE